MANQEMARAYMAGYRSGMAAGYTLARGMIAGEHVGTIEVSEVEQLLTGMSGPPQGWGRKQKVTRGRKGKK